MSDQSKSVGQRIIESLRQFTEELEHDDHPELTGAIQHFMDCLSKINEPNEVFPWKPCPDRSDLILDANGDRVAFLFGYGGKTKSYDFGVAHRRRLILEVPAMLDLLHAIAASSDTAREILARINGVSK